MKKKVKWLSFVLAVITVLSVFVIPAYAANVTVSSSAAFNAIATYASNHGKYSGGKYVYTTFLSASRSDNISRLIYDPNQKALIIELESSISKDYVTVPSTLGKSYRIDSEGKGAFDGLVANGYINPNNWDNNGVNISSWYYYGPSSTKNTWHENVITALKLALLEVNIDLSENKEKYGMYDLGFTKMFDPLDDSDTHFTDTLSGTATVKANNLKSPQSAWQKTKVYTHYSFNRSFCDLQLLEMYTGDQAAKIVEEENLFNDDPASGQQWILMRWRLKNNGTEAVKGSDLVFKSYFYTKSGASMTIHDFATLGEKLKSVFDVNLYSGASDEFWCGILVNIKDGYPLLQVGAKGIDGKYTEGWLDTTPVIPTPKITSQPQPITIKSGGTATFSVIATGKSLSYQWQYKKAGTTKWVDFSGKTSAVLNFTLKMGEYNGCEYRCVVKNPGGKVTSKAARVSVVTHECPGKGFYDMPLEGNWAHEPIDWAISTGLTSGTSSTKFSPEGPCTRAQVVTFLWRDAGEPSVSGVSNPFKDVKSSDYFYKAVLWAVSQKITAGKDATHFAPSNTCTRGEFVTFLWRYKGSKSPTTKRNPFSDIKSTDFFYKPVLWAVENDITKGTDSTHFAPTQTCNRAQVVAFLWRMKGSPKAVS